jgi:hypothetical protein
MGTLRLLVAVIGGVAAAWVLLSAIRTVVLPRSVDVALTHAVFVTIRVLFTGIAKRARSYEDRDRIMALDAPIALMALAGAWALGIIVAFAAVFWGLGVDPLRQAFVISGSSFTTLGFAPPRDVPTDLAAVTEAVLGLSVVALLISFLPSMYGAFQRRELRVSLLATRAGDPPSPVRLLVRDQQINNVLSEEWYAGWGEWFADIEESHTSQGALVFFRSPLAQRSWVTATGCVLDTAALSLSVIDTPNVPQAALCIRSGYLCLRRIADRMGVAYDPDPAPDDPITIAREEFDDVCRRLEQAGVPLKDDRDQAWRDFAGWRVNYDAVLVQLAGLVMAPYAPWSSDRSLSGSLRLRWLRGKGNGPVPERGSTGFGGA